jgi:DNA mismatch repair ATPase MutS
LLIHHLLDLDEEVGDIASDIKDRQKTLLVAVEEMIIDSEEALQQLAVTFASLDAYLSLGSIAIEMRFTRPVRQPMLSEE